MKQLWAPWRMEFILGEKETGCIFCNRVERNTDREDLILARGQQSFVILNKFPYSNGHLMVVPYRHTETMAGLDAETSAEMMASLATWSEILTTTLKAEGFNVGLNLGKAAGAGIPDHIHFHLVPRWVGDTNFMPVFSDTKVMPQAMDETYEALVKAWEQR